VALTMSLEEFARHGSPERSTRDGWGIAYYHGRDVRLIKDTAPAASSEWLGFVAGHCLRSPTVLSHIRHATQGDVCYSNTQPFERELGGRRHVLAHNGNLADIRAAVDLSGGGFRPIGDTDSEWAFCALLQRMAPLWRDPARLPDLDRRLEVFSGFAAGMRQLGPANFLYADGDALFLHADRRRQADGRIVPPGLWRVERECAPDSPGHPEIAGAALETERQRVVLAASVPLTGEAWHPMARGEVVALRQGRIVARSDGESSAQG